MDQLQRLPGLNRLLLSQKQHLRRKQLQNPKQLPRQRSPQPRAQPRVVKSLQNATTILNAGLAAAELIPFAERTF